MQEGCSTASFLRRTMSKLLGERIMSKQEKCHLMLGLPIVHCSHQQVYVNLKNDNHQVKVDSRERIVDDPNPGDEPREDPNFEIVMSLVDAYAGRNTANLWADVQVFESMEDPNAMTLLQFCLKYKVLRHGVNCNKISTNEQPIVVNFNPNPSSSSDSDEYCEYCKFMLMRYRPWAEEPSKAWNDIESDEAIICLWEDYLLQFRDNPPNFLQVALANHQANKKNDEMMIEQNEEGSFDSLNPPDEEDDDLLNAQDTFISHPAEDHEFDLDIKWDEKHNWMDKNLDFVIEEDANKYKEKLNEVRNLSNNKEDAHVGYDKLNAEQKLAHDMILEAC